jgi:hypothetical protein
MPAFSNSSIAREEVAIELSVLALIWFDEAARNIFKPPVPPPICARGKVG